ncbi:hypothetical protein L486_04502 [Kwoniella mangroviensis CBS 10435]|uniref:RING-type domain-containing protein n=1 Tax=Kwoniella mangroviensis CBS 10435 TaxID=1331196 RepID=A0A1B9ISG7_9TREE|nr:hypothetical protein L486_04502 [Kwoniella mangroviensis CBS 10435]
MNTGRTGVATPAAAMGRRRDEPSGSRGNTPAGGVRAKPRKKPKPSSSPTPRVGPIPAPYLALAPTPISSLSASTIDQLAATAATTSSNLILPSSYVRSSQERRNRSTPNLNTAGEGAEEAGPSSRPANSRQQQQQQKYVTSLLSPPTIIPGGTSSTPRIPSTQPQAPPNTRRRSADRAREGISTRRSQERLRELVIGNPSLTSLGQLGQILESGHLPEETNEESDLARAQQDVQAQAQRRRRRIVRGDTAETSGVRRRLTVSSREEGRALGLARRASMRRTNVWDDIPEAGEPPPPFPFPTPSTARLPPAFGTTPDTANSSQSPPDERPRSPPPSFEIATGLSTAPSPALPTSSSTPSTPRAEAKRPILTVSTSIPQVNEPDSADPTAESPSSTHYASAPSSPTHTVIGFEDIRASERTKREERDDRKAWNEDLLAGYTLEERVRREMDRRKGREVIKHNGEDEVGSEGSEETEGVEVPIQDEFPTEPESSDPTGIEDTHYAERPPSRLEEHLEYKTETSISRAGEETPIITNDHGPSSEYSQLMKDETNVSDEKLNDPSADSLSTSDNDKERGISAGSSDAASISTSVVSSDTHSAIRQSEEGSSSKMETAAQSGSPQKTVEDSLKVQAPPVQAIIAEPAAPITTPLFPASQEGVQDQSNTIKTPKRRKPSRSSTVETESSPNASSSLNVKRLSVPEFSPFRPQLDRALSHEPLFSKHGWNGSPELESSAHLGTILGNDQATENFSERPIDQAVRTALPSKSSLPPSREAALKRRNLESKSPKPGVPPSAAMSLPKPKANVKIVEQKPISGPLINFDTPSSSPPGSVISTAQVDSRERPTSSDISALAASSAELLTLLELQDQIFEPNDGEPIAESSAQGAARMARKPPPPPPKRNIDPGVTRRVPPPLPKGQAQSPPAKNNLEEASSPSIESGRPAIAPRRAPPPIPPRLNLIPRQPPPLPPRVNPNDDKSSHTTPMSPSAESDDTIKAFSPAVAPRLSLTGPNPGHVNKPKGPRPRPPPPRARQTSCFKGFSPLASRPAEINLESANPATTDTVSEIPLSNRPNNDRAQSDFPHLVSPVEAEAKQEERERVIERSSSAMNLGASESRSSDTNSVRQPESPVQPQASLPLSDVGQSSGEAEEVRREWTDLDLLVSRIQDLPSDQTGVYEGYTQISQFLGPSKSQAATPAALANLLPGLINVDSRRTTPQGKVKLKLSLLGLRVTKCGICLSQFKAGEKGVMLPMCSHVGHESCARRWFRERGSCWVCRMVLPEE